MIEAANKLLITGALQFVSPGSTTQVFAGVVISFVSLQAYQRGLPYTNKAVRQIGFSAAMVLFLFFFFALLVKAGVALTNNDTLFYGTIIGALSVAVFGVPAIIIAIRLYYKRPGEGLEEEEEEEDAEEEAKEEAVLAEEAAAPQAKGGPSGWEIFSKDVRWLRAQVADLPRRIVGGLTETQKQEIRCEIQRATSHRPARLVSVRSRGLAGAEHLFRSIIAAGRRSRCSTPTTAAPSMSTSWRRRCSASLSAAKPLWAWQAGSLQLTQPSALLPQGFGAGPVSRSLGKDDCGYRPGWIRHNRSPRVLPCVWCESSGFLCSQCPILLTSPAPPVSLPCSQDARAAAAADVPRQRAQTVGKGQEGDAEHGQDAASVQVGRACGQPHWQGILQRRCC